MATGILYIEEGEGDMHTQAGSVDTPMVELPYEDLCPGSAALDKLMDEFR